MRQTLYTLHKYSGLLLGVILALIGLSGSLLVFDHALDEALTPQLRGLAVQQNASLQQVLDTAKAAAPADAKATRIYLARQPGSPHTVRFTGPPPDNASIEISIDPDTANLLVSREWGHYPMSWLYRLHYTLLAGETGETIVGILGITLLFFCASGLFLWWPRHGRWRNALRVVRRAGPIRLFWDLHRVIGVCSVPVLTICAITGIAIVFSKPVSVLISAIATTKDIPSYSVTPSGSRPLPLDSLVQKAKTTWPNGEIKRLFLPQREVDSLRLIINLPGEPWSNHGASSIWLNPYNGDVLGVWDARKLPAGNTALAWIFPLHNADVLGLPGRWLWVITGITPLFLFGTGVYLWGRKRRRR